MISTIWHGIKEKHWLLELSILSETITEKEVLQALHDNQGYRKVYVVTWNEQQADILFHRGFEKECILKDHIGKGVDGVVYTKFQGGE